MKKKIERENKNKWRENRNKNNRKERRDKNEERMRLTERDEMRRLEVIILTIIAFALIVLSANVLAFQSVSAIEYNETIEVKTNIDNAKICLDEMLLKNISVKRANESFISGMQLYTAKQLLINKKTSGDYKRINDYLLAVCMIKNAALKASDELKIFIDFYNEANKSTDMTAFNPTYQKVLASFRDERFEETISMIDEGYREMADVQAQQTALKVFYNNQIATLKNFLIDNWKYILIVVVVGSVVIVLSWRGIKRWILNSKMRHLYAQKEALDSLIKKIQKRYFEENSVSEFEYRTKLKRYKEMMLDVERQIPLIREEIVRVDRMSFLKALKKRDENQTQISSGENNTEIKKKKKRKATKKR